MISSSKHKSLNFIRQGMTDLKIFIEQRNIKIFLA